MGRPSLLLFLVAHLSLAQAGARIEGRVASTTGEPVPRAMVRLGSTQLSTLADDDAKFVFESVAPGRYSLTAEKAGFLRPTLERKPPAILNVVSGNKLEGVIVRITPQAVIAGKITDATGDPVAGALITPIRYDYPQGRRELTPAGPTAQSDDRGEYRLANLAPGRYYLRVRAPRPADPRAVSQPTPETNVTTFFPSVLDASAARPLNVAAGEELRGIDVQIRRVRVYTVSGTAVELATGTELDLIPKGAQLSMSGIPNAAVTEVRPDGSFEFRDVQSGAYDLFSVSPSGAHAEVVVTSNVTGVVAAFRSLAPVLGSIAMEDGSAPPLISVRVIPMEGAPARPAMIRPQGDGTFELRAGATKYLWSVSGLPDGTYVKSASFAGHDITYSLLDNTSGTGGTIQIVFSPKAATLSGRVRDKNDQPMQEAAVTLWLKGGGISQTTTDQNGEFQFRSLAPGNYFLAAWEEIDRGIAQSPEFLARFNAEASVIKLEENSRLAVDANLIPRDRVEAEMANVP